MQPLIVTAHTPNGFSSADPWSPALEAILAYWQLRTQLGDEEFALSSTGVQPMVEADSLPLGREIEGDDWWWQCSSPVYASATEFRRWYHRRFDLHQAARFAPEGTRRVEVSAGPYKAYRNADMVHLAPTVTWFAIGDPAEITRLLLPCVSIGAGLSRGAGRVLRWEVSAGDDEAAHLARFARPIPVEFAARHGIEGSQLRWGIRPPGRLPEHQRLCLMP